LVVDGRAKKLRTLLKGEKHEHIKRSYAEIHGDDNNKVLKNNHDW
jgi:hypothetical protein